MGLVLFGTIRANGEVVGPLLVLVVALYPVRIGVAYFGSARFGADALWLSYPIGMVAAMAMAALLYRYGGWRDGTLLPPAASECVQRALHHREPLGTVQPVV